MESISVQTCTPSQAAVLSVVVAALPPAAWETFSFSPDELVKPSHTDTHSRYMGVRGHTDTLATPLFEEQMPMGNNQIALSHRVVVGKILGDELGLDPHAILEGPLVKAVFEAALSAHTSYLNRQSQD